MSETKVFVSYARADHALAEEVLRKLRPLPVLVWSDNQIAAGANWERTLRNQLQEAEYFLLLVTPNTLDAPYVLQELGAAWALGKNIVSVVSDKALVSKLPIEVSRSQIVPADEIDRLRDIIKRPKPAAATRL